MSAMQTKKMDHQQMTHGTYTSAESDKETAHDEKMLNELFMQSRSGLWGLFSYLAASVLAFYFRDQSLATVVPASVMQQLGAVPPVCMANWVLWISTLSALTIIAGRLYHASRPSSTLTHLLFRIAFFVLYFVVGGLDQHINEIFISGLIVLALQHHNVLSYYSKEIEMNLGVYSCP